MCIKCWRRYNQPMVLTRNTFKAVEEMKYILDKLRYSRTELGIFIEEYDLEDDRLNNYEIDDWLKPEEKILMNNFLTFLKSISLNERVSARAIIDDLIPLTSYKKAQA